MPEEWPPRDWERRVDLRVAKSSSRDCRRRLRTSSLCCWPNQATPQQSQSQKPRLTSVMVQCSRHHGTAPSAEPLLGIAVCQPPPHGPCEAHPEEPRPLCVAPGLPPVNQPVELREPRCDDEACAQAVRLGCVFAHALGGARETTRRLRRRANRVQGMNTMAAQRRCCRVADCRTRVWGRQSRPHQSRSRCLPWLGVVPSSCPDLSQEPPTRNRYGSTAKHRVAP